MSQVDCSRSAIALGSLTLLRLRLMLMVLCSGCLTAAGGAAAPPPTAGCLRFAQDGRFVRYWRGEARITDAQLAQLLEEIEASRLAYHRSQSAQRRLVIPVYVGLGLIVGGAIGAIVSATGDPSRRSDGEYASVGVVMGGVLVGVTGAGVGSAIAQRRLTEALDSFNRETHCR